MQLQTYFACLNIVNFFEKFLITQIFRKASFNYAEGSRTGGKRL